MFRKTIKLLFIGFLVAQSTSCIRLKKLPVEEMLVEMGIDQTSFASMSPCAQIEVYAEVGKEYLDRDHLVAIVPNWMDQIIDIQPPEITADCISLEGLRQLHELSQQSNSEDEISLALHALTYKAYNSELLEYPQMKDFLHQAVCNANVKNSYDLVLIYYVSEYETLPDYINENDVREKMLAELCK